MGGRRFANPQRWHIVEARDVGVLAALARQIATMEMVALAMSLGFDQDAPAHHCHCLCGTHPQARGVCTGRHDLTVTLSGGIEPWADVPMCDPCALAWQTTRPERVVRIQNPE